MQNLPDETLVKAEFERIIVEIAITYYLYHESVHQNVGNIVRSLKKLKDFYIFYLGNIYYITYTGQDKSNVILFI